MNLFGIDYSQQAATAFQLVTPGRQTETASETAQASASESATSPSGSNMLAGLFVHAVQENSRYITGLKAGLAAQNDFLNQMQSVVAGYRHIMEISGEMSYAERNLIGEKAAKAVATMVDDEVKETNTEKLEEIREDIEEKAEEAVAPESGEVIENETSPQEGLEESLEEAAPESQAKALAAQEAQQEAASEQDAAPQDAVAEQTASGQETPETTPATPTIDIVV